MRAYLWLLSAVSFLLAACQWALILKTFFLLLWGWITSITPPPPPTCLWFLRRSSCLRFLNICSVSGVFLLGDRGTPNARPPTAVDLRSPIMSNEKVIKVSTGAFIFFFFFVVVVCLYLLICYCGWKMFALFWKKKAPGPQRHPQSLLCGEKKKKKQKKVAQIARVRQMQLKLRHNAATCNIFCIRIRCTYGGCMTTCDICHLVPRSNSRTGSVFKQTQSRREWTDLGTRWWKGSWIIKPRFYGNHLHGFLKRERMRSSGGDIQIHPTRGVPDFFTQTKRL